MRALIACGAALAWLVCWALAHAAPPEGADPKLAPWFQSLRQPGTGASCCNLADCRRVQYRIRGDHFQAFIGSAFPRWTRAPYDWVDVPNKNVLHRQDNPTGEGVACWRDGEVICFVEGNTS
ncbi:MAG: hypothetical protein JO227_14870 [Acetobacteraceae bacterium]|nr:hypothetical protein [Acetobacteraceae bacterium]